MSIQAQAVPVENPFADARRAFDDLVEELGSTASTEWTHSEAERKIEVRGREVLRRMFQGFLDAHGPGDAVRPVVDESGTQLGYRRVRERRLMSIFGPVYVERAGYYTTGASTLCPRDAELNLPPESYSFETQRRNAIEAARGSFEAAVSALRRGTGANVPKRQTEELVTRAVVDFDDYYRERSLSEEASAGELVVISVDGKGVVVRPEDLRPATLKAAATRTRKLSTKLSKGEKRGSKRMATVAAVYTIDRFHRKPEDIVGELRRIRKAEARRPKPRGKRVWASLEKEPEVVITHAFEEALRRDPNREKPWVVLVDGHESQLRIVRRVAKRFKVKAQIVLDLFHVLGYLWDAAHALTVEGTRHSEDWVTKRLFQVLEGHAGRVAAAMRRSATLRGYSAERRAPVDKCASYLLKYRKYVTYDNCLEQGLPVATGVVEGACRHLINDRMDITGARWSMARAEAVLKVRALMANSDFETYWASHEDRERTRNHLCRYQGSSPPSTVTHRPHRHLRLIK
jgi:hypothetical protein